MSKPKRIQRKRTKGWRMPDGAVYVGRPTKWGNPFAWLSDEPSGALAVARYRRWLTGGNNPFSTRLPPQSQEIAQLRGKDLACWCPLVDKDGNRVPCHADVLLELANQ